MQAFCKASVFPQLAALSKHLSTASALLSDRDRFSFAKASSPALAGFRAAFFIGDRSYCAALMRLVFAPCLHALLFIESHNDTRFNLIISSGNDVSSLLLR
jgi:hypothetical protein